MFRFLQLRFGIAQYSTFVHNSQHMSIAGDTTLTTPAAEALPDSLDKMPREPVARKQRLIGLAIVLGVAFASSVLTSVLRVWGVHFDYPDNLLGYRYFNNLLHELLGLALLAYVARQNRQALADFGATFRMTNIATGLILWLGAEVCYRLAFPTIFSICELMGWHRVAPYYPSGKLGLNLLTFCFIVVNPVFEEMIVRAFLMSEVLAMTGSSSLAICLSLTVQTSYHLYQGVPYALGVGVIFSIFSIYYARTRQIWPVIIAHFIMDLSFHLRVHS